MILGRLLVEYCVNAALMTVTNLMSSCGAINWETNEIWNGVTTDIRVYILRWGLKIDHTEFFDVFLTVHHSIDLFQITKLTHNSFILQQYVCYTTILNMFRAARCSSTGGQIVSPQSLVSSQPYSMPVDSGLQSTFHLRTVRLFTEGDDTRGCGDTICSPVDEQRAARNMLRSVV